MKEIIRYFDLFSGIGGFRQAIIESRLDDVEFVPVGFCEIDGACKSLYEYVFCPNTSSELFFPDVNGISTNGQSNKLPKFDLLMAGFPCQAFSNVGRRGSFSDPRGKLFFEIIRLLHYYRPRFFILENVQKIATIRSKGLLIEMTSALEDIGYFVSLWDLCASSYSLPQQRRRFFFCGVDKRTIYGPLSLMPPPHVDRQNWKYPTVWHLLERDADPKHYIPPKTRKTVLRRNVKWQGDLKIDRPIARPLTATMAKWHRANQDNYYSDTYISPSNDNPYVSPDIDIEKEPIRRITPLEGFRLQGFPDKFNFACDSLKLSTTTIYRLIGNAVPVSLARAVIDHHLEAYL